MTTQDVLNILILFAIGVLAYFVILKIISFEPTSKRNRLSKILNEQSSKERTLRTKYPIFNYLVPSFVIGQTEGYKVPYTKKMYVTYFVVGTVIGVIAFFLYFKAFIYLIPFSMVGGVIATLIKLHTLRRDQMHEINYQLSVYMSSFTTAYETFGNLRGTLSSLLSSVDSSIKPHLEKAYLILSEGKTPRQAFYEMNQVFPQKNVRLFHEQIQAIENSGTSDISKLRIIAENMKKKEVYKKELSLVSKSQFRVWRTLLFLIFSLPFMFVVVSYDNFIAIQNNVVANITLFMAAIYSLFIFTKFTQLEVYDPTEPNK
jgi:hypothetical protein